MAVGTEFLICPHAVNPMRVSFGDIVSLYDLKIKGETAAINIFGVMGCRSNQGHRTNGPTE